MPDIAASAAIPLVGQQHNSSNTGLQSSRYEAGYQQPTFRLPIRPTELQGPASTSICDVTCEGQIGPTFDIDIDEDFGMPSTAAEARAAPGQSNHAAHLQTGADARLQSIRQQASPAGALPHAPQSSAKPHNCSPDGQPRPAYAVDQKPASRLHSSSPRQQTRLAAAVQQVPCQTSTLGSPDHGSKPQSTAADAHHMSSSSGRKVSTIKSPSF